MDDTEFKSFKEIIKDERYKKMQRDLKLARLRDEAMRANKGSLSIWPSLSSISGDAMDTSYVYSTVAGSEIISSSSNMKNILMKSKRSLNEHNTMTTSSVKAVPISVNENYAEKDKEMVDRLAMPPPSFHKPNHNPRKSISCEEDSGISIIKELSHNNIVDNNDCSVELNENVRSINYQQNNNLEKARVFTQWKIMLNNKGQLLIKGLLKCGKLARSKPVMRRITSTKLESINKYIYCIEGNLVDTNYELPDYVRDKFINGFPDDWQNVCQIWNTYVTTGCDVTFRWPTHVTDSDDDLNTAITDESSNVLPLNQCSSKNTTNVQHLARNTILQQCSQFTHSAPNLLEAELRCTSNKINTETFISHHDNDEPKIVGFEKSSDQLNKSTNRKLQQTANSTTDSINRSSSKMSHKLADYIREDKLDIILKNLANKDVCSQEYLNKVCHVLNCLNELISYDVAIETNDDLNYQSNNSMFMTLQSKAINAQKSLSCFDESQCRNDIRRTRKQLDLKPKETHNMFDNDGNNSEVYGVPKIPAYLIHRPRKFRNKRICRKDNNHDAVISCSNVEPNVSIENDYDSSVSIVKEQEFTRNHVPNVKYNEKNMCETDNLVSGTDSGCISPSSINNFSKTNSHINENQVVKRHYDDACFEMDKDSSMGTQTAVLNPKRAFRIDESKKPKVTHSVTSHIKVHVLQSEQGEQLKSLTKCNEDIDESTHNENKENRVNPGHNTTFQISTQNDDLNNECYENSHVQTGKSNMMQNSVQATNVVLKNKNDSIEQQNNNDIYGSKKHPKLLTAWMPKLSKSDCGLIFQGQLLNEAGQIMDRKYCTDVIYRRLTSDLVETVNHEFIKLIGELTDTKHLVPKELIKHCQSGCPANLNKFCEEWKLLIEQEEDMQRKILDDLSICRSSRGRHIIPTLNYWEGERIGYKDHNPVYCCSKNLKQLTQFSKATNVTKKPKSAPPKSTQSKRIPRTNKRSVSQRLDFSENNDGHEEGYNMTLRSQRKQKHHYSEGTKTESTGATSGRVTYVVKMNKNVSVMDNILSDDQISEV